MASSETNGDGRPINPSGVYRHPDSGEELVFQATSKFGNPGADAAIRLGFQYVGEAKFSEAPQKSEKAALYAQQDPTALPTANTDPHAKSVGELEAELEAAKAREQLRADSLKDKSSLVKNDKKAEKAQAPAKDQEAK